MNVLITQTHRSKYSTTIEAICDKTTGVVSMYPDGSMQVLCVNAAHRCWKGGGRWVRNLSEALETYRSAAMKAIIQAGADLAAREAAEAKAKEEHETALLMYEHGVLGHDYYDCFRNMEDGVN